MKVRYCTNLQTQNCRCQGTTTLTVGACVTTSSPEVGSGMREGQRNKLGYALDDNTWREKEVVKDLAGKNRFRRQLGTN